ncbi:MAG: mechanosensitive ion channel domain-containing protein [Myxococcota bacterium]
MTSRLIDETSTQHRDAQPLKRVLLRFVTFIALLTMLVSTSACESPAELLFPAKKTATPAVETAESDKKDESKSDSEPSSEKIDVRTFEPTTQHAEEILEEKFEGFFRRKPLGFSSQLPTLVLQDLQDLGQRLASIPDSIRGMSAMEILRGSLPLLAILVLGMIFWVIDRTLLRWVTRWSSRIHVDISRWLTRALRTLVMIIGRIGSVAVLLALSYFPVQALAERAPWSEFVTDLIWLALAYRAIHTTLVMVFSGSLLKIPYEHGARLEVFAVWLTRMIVGFLIALAAIEHFDYREQVYAFTLVAMKTCIALAPLYLFLVRDSVLSLLPEYEQRARLYRFFRKLLATNYYALLAFTVVLLSLWAAGYVRASTFLLTRSYAIIGLWLVVFIAGQATREYFDRRASPSEGERLEPGQDAPQLANAVEKLLFFAGGVLVVALTLKLLAVYEALLALTKVPLLAVGKISISVYNLLLALLIVIGTSLAIKLVKAVLNAKVYPSLEVDVGVAYAVNTIINYVLIVIGFFFVLNALGVNLSAVTVVIASLGVGIGFGLQTLTENLISGFIILFGRSVKKGDFITVNDTYGRVEAVGARSVVIKTPDNYDMLIPSKEIVGGQITNWTFHDSIIRSRIDVGVTYKADPEVVEEVLLKVAAESEYALDDPQPEVWLVGFGDSSVNFQLLLHYDCRQISPYRLKGRIYFQIWDALHEAAIEIPFPQRDLHVRSADIMPELKEMMQAKREEIANEDSEATIESLVDAVERTKKDRESDDGASDDGASDDASANEDAGEGDEE